MRTNRSVVLATLVVTAALATSVLAQSSGSYNLRRFVVAGGGGRAADGDVELHGTIGQGWVGVSTGPGIRLSSGFWWPEARSAPSGTPTVHGTVSPSATAHGLATPTILPTGAVTLTPAATSTGQTPTAGPTAPPTSGPSPTPSPASSPTGGPTPTQGELTDIWLPIVAKGWSLASD